MAKKLLASAGSKEGLEKMINEFWFTDNRFIITDDNKIHDTKKDEFVDSCKVVRKQNRWRFEMV